MSKIIITQEIPKIATDILEKSGHQVQTLSKNGPLPHGDLVNKIKGADGIISVLTDIINEPLLESAGDKLKIVANYAVGFDNIDLKAAGTRNIVVTNTPGVLTEAVAEHTLALLFSLAKNIVPADKFVRAGNYKHWQPMGFLGPQLWGKTLGIVGLGRIGSFLAEICYYGLKMDIIYFDVQRDERFEMELKADYHLLHSLLKKSDIVSVHVPLLPQTKHLLGKEEFKLMKKTAFLINTSRGPVIDEIALVDALKRKHFAGAGLDVFEQEPKVNSKLLKMDNVVLTPHIASATSEARNSMAEIAAKNVVAVLSGKKPITPVT